MRTLILADIHIYPNRQAGTTKESRKALEDWQMVQLKKNLEIPHDKLIIAGDLTDKRNIPEHLMKELIDIFSKENCTILLGNHDLAGVDDHTISSTEFIAMMSNSTLIKEPTELDGVYFVPHMHEQSEFDRAIQDCPNDTLMITHANIDNFFAVQSDHSLNITLHQLKDLEKRGVHVITGHEHAPREYHNVTVVGCQTPTSIADCSSGDKRCIVLEDGFVLLEPAWDAAVGYYEGSELPDKDYDFINITGECELNEFSGIVKKVAELRKTSKAFIVKNSVKVRNSESIVSVDDVTKFNVLELLVEAVHKDYKEDVKTCM